MATTRVASALLAGLAALSLLSGCGADTRRAERDTATGAQVTTFSARLSRPSPATQATDPERRAYVAAVDRICARWDRDRNTTRERVAKAIDVREAATAYQETITGGTQQLQQIEAVPVPPADRQALQANVFAVVGHQLVLRRQIDAALASANVARLQHLRLEMDGLSQSLAAFARGYGFQVCGEQ
jgi:hypothetical protein